MKNRSKSLTVMIAGLLAFAPALLAQNEGVGQGEATITVLPKDEHAPPSNVAEQSVQVQVAGKSAQITSWQSEHTSQAPVELVLMIDSGARESLGREMDDINHFIQGLPPNVKVTLAYMEYGRAKLAGPLTTDHAAAAKEIHLPAGMPGMNASPYFCLSDLAKHWPSSDRSAFREVIMITDGVDYYELHYDPEDPYVQSAMRDAARADVVVYSIYWRDTGRVDRTGYENNAGQNLLEEVTQATGGNSYWIGYGNPVSLTPYFDDFSRRLNNQYELGFTAPLRGKASVENLKVKVSAPEVKVTAPQQVWLGSQGAGNPE
ncbi:MAG: hypothetical protein WBG54_03040 [Acidobacteriaceae bacterium]